MTSCPSMYMPTAGVAELVTVSVIGKSLRLGRSARRACVGRMKSGAVDPQAAPRGVEVLGQTAVAGRNPQAEAKGVDDPLHCLRLRALQLERDERAAAGRCARRVRPVLPLDQEWQNRPM